MHVFRVWKVINRLALTKAYRLTYWFCCSDRSDCSGSRPDFAGGIAAPSPFAMSHLSIMYQMAASQRLIVGDVCASAGR